MEEIYTMKKMMKCLVLAMAVLAVAGTAWSWDFNDHVKIAPNGQGDILIYPFYGALNGGWETKIWVVNTSPNRSVVAHLAFYSARTSVELLDFFLFLTPTDVWNGTVRYANGNVEIYSTDDSAMTAAGTFASATNPLRVNLQNPLRATCNANAEPFTNTIGYVKVLEAAHSDALASTVYTWPRGTNATVNLNSPPVNKLALYEAFNDFLTAAGVGAPTGNAATNPLVLDGINVLAGHLEFRNPTLGQNSTIPATVLRDYDNQLPVGYGQSIGFAANNNAAVNPGCGYLAGLPLSLASVTPAAPSITPAMGGVTVAGCQVGGGLAAGPVAATTVCAGVAGCGCTAGGYGCQHNSVGEVEAALAKDWLAMPYMSKTLTAHILTLPTKQTTRAYQDCYYSSSPSPFFNETITPAGGTARVTQANAIAARGTYNAIWETWGCFPYATTSYDLTERSSTVTSIFSPGAQPNSLCGEVQIGVGFAFDEGWTVYNFTSGPLGIGSYNTRFDVQGNAVVGTFDAQYSGAPIIGTVLHLGADGLTLLPTSYADGEVRYLGTDGATGGVAAAADIIHHYYQYWDQSNINDVSGIGAAAPAGPGGGALGAGIIAGSYNGSDEDYACAIAGLGVVPEGTFGCVIAGLSGFVPANVNQAIYLNKFAGNRAGMTFLPFPAAGVADVERPAHVIP